MSSIHVARVLPSWRVFRSKLDTGERSLLAGDCTNEFDNAMHVPRHHNGVSHFDYGHVEDG
jgi:hypothetical protein